MSTSHSICTEAHKIRGIMLTQEGIVSTSHSICAEAHKIIGIMLTQEAILHVCFTDSWKRL